jgi:hypothetical protein
MIDTTLPKKEMDDKKKRGIFDHGKRLIETVDLLTGFDVQIVFNHKKDLLSTQSKLISQSVLIVLIILLAFCSGGLVVSELLFHSDRTYSEIFNLLFNDVRQLSQIDYLYFFLSPILILLISTVWAFIILNLYRLVIIISMNIDLVKNKQDKKIKGAPSQHDGVRRFGRIMFGILFSVVCGFMLSMPLLRINFDEDIAAYSQIQNREVLEDSIRNISKQYDLSIRNAYKDLYNELPYDFPIDQINSYVPQLAQDGITQSQTLESVEGLTNCSFTYLGNANQGKFAFNKSEIMQCMNELRISVKQLEKEAFGQSSTNSPFVNRLKALQMQKERLQADQLLALYHQLRPPGLVQSSIVVFKAVPLISWTFVCFVIFMMLSPILLKIFGPKSIYDYFVDEYNRIPLAEKGIQLHRFDVIDKTGKDAGLIDRYFEYEELVESQKQIQLEKLKNMQESQFVLFREKYNRIRDRISRSD